MPPPQVKRRRRRVDASAPRPLGTMTAKYGAYDPAAAGTGELSHSKPSALMAEVTQGRKLFEEERLFQLQALPPLEFESSQVSPLCGVIG